MSQSKFTRRYLGVTITADNYREILKKEGREGINFHTKHLRSYLRGDKSFTFGWNRDEEGNRISPKVHNVLYQLINLNKK